MNDSDFVEVFDAINELVEQPTSLIFAEAMILDDVVEELPIFHVLHEEEQFFISLADVVELYYIGMAHQLEDVNFPQYSFGVGCVAYLAFL